MERLAHGARPVARKILVAPDSFKGTLSSAEVCDLVDKGIRSVYPGAHVVKLPVADGGEGTVDAVVQAVGGTKRPLTVKDPYSRDIRAFYAVLPDGRTAVVEMAAASGLPLVGDRRDPSATTSFGTGQLIRAALREGCREIILGLGGSATNDGGVGIAAALGYRFLDRQGREIPPTGGGLASLECIDASQKESLLESCRLRLACDVDNPLCGPQGASLVFGPQKGASPEMASQLDRNLCRLAEIIARDLGKEVLDLPGGGAAGGAGAGLVAFAGATLEPGAKLVLDLVGFNHALQGADLVITGEGRMDAQTLRGKAPLEVIKRAARQGVPVIALVGNIGEGISAVYDIGLTAVFSINRRAVPLQEARRTSREDLIATAQSLTRVLLMTGWA